jgi:hypothetical protein
MTPTDDMVPSRPHTAVATELHDHRGATRTRRAARRGLLALPIALALTIPATPALGQTSSTGTSGYGQKAPVPTTTEPKSGTAPSKEATTPKTETAPEPTTTTTTPAKTTVSPNESKLPFTGLDLRWVIGGGMLLLAAGLSLRISQRRGAGR